LTPRRVVEIASVVMLEPVARFGTYRGRCTGARRGPIALAPDERPGCDIGAALACGCGTAQRADQASGVADRPLPPEVRPVLTAQFHVPSGAVDLAASDGALWVSGVEAVSRLDPVTGRVVARISTPGKAVYSSIAAGEGSIWATAGATVYRIDPSTDRVAATIHVGGSVLGIAAGAGRVWVTRPMEGPGEVIRIDPQTNRVAGPPIKVGPGPAQIAYGQGAVWVENTSPPSVMRIDPATGNVSAVPVVGVTAVGYGSLWAASDDSLTRFEAKTGQVVASVRIPRGVAVAIGAGEVWDLAYPRSSSPTVFDPIKHTAALWEVDPRNNQIIGTPIRLDALQPIAITATDTNVWVADYKSGTITRLRLVPCHGCK
jgi:streptogramin lyase